MRAYHWVKPGTNIEKILEEGLKPSSPMISPRDQELLKNSLINKIKPIKPPFEKVIYCFLNECFSFQELLYASRLKFATTMYNPNKKSFEHLIEFEIKSSDNAYVVDYVHVENLKLGLISVREAYKKYFNSLTPLQDYDYSFTAPELIITNTVQPNRLNIKTFNPVETVEYLKIMKVGEPSYWNKIIEKMIKTF